MQKLHKPESMRLKDSDKALKVRQATLSTLELTGQGCLGGWLALGMAWLVEVGLLGVGCAWPVGDKCIPKSRLKCKQTVKDCKCISKSSPLTGEKQLSNHLIPAVSS